MAQGGVSGKLSGIVAVLAFLLALDAAGAVPISNRYRSPRNPERRIRSSTELIVLHTTEAPARSSLNKVSDRGECHFCVTEDGSVYRIVDRDREAFHAGRSMWNGKEDVDKFSIGIECVGHHDKRMGDIQLNSIRALVKELQAMYRIPDERVVCHSHVAYGAPNKWHKFKHRGRKRCGMLFAMPSVRRRLGLMSRPAFDPDTRAFRLRNADEYLRKVLYGSVDTMAAAYGGKPSVRPVVKAAGQVIPSRPAGSAGPSRPAVQQAARRPVTQPVQAARHPVTQPVKAVRSSPPPAAVRRPANVADLKAQGYQLRGQVSKSVSAARIAGAKWNAADTYYVMRGKVIPGTQIDAAHIENGVGIWMKK